MGLKIGVLGAGSFAQRFIPLYQLHPQVDEVVIADVLPDRVRETAKRWGIKRTFESLTELCKSDVDAIAIFTQRNMHSPQVVEALKAGKHVYSAVPMAHTLEGLHNIIEEVKRTGLIYMTGETSYYYPCTLYSRNRFKKGDFGDFVYGEAAYIHDMSHGFYEAFQYSGGEDWKKVAGFPPMFYPTHSVSMILSVTGAKATSVSCLGYKDRHEDGIFREGTNLWDNPFSNETALMRTSDGGIMRINEFRRVGWIGERERMVHMSMFGTKGSYEEQANAQVWTTLDRKDMVDLTETLKCFDVKVDEEDKHLHEQLQKDFHAGTCKIHPIDRLPEEYKGAPNGHAGSHQFLTDDFVKAVTYNKLPATNAWVSASFAAPGIIAHESALRDGETMKIPDFGNPPSNWESLNLPGHL